MVKTPAFFFSDLGMAPLDVVCSPHLKHLGADSKMLEMCTELRRQESTHTLDMYVTWLVVWNMAFIFPIIPLTNIFQSG